VCVCVVCVCVCVVCVFHVHVIWSHFSSAITELTINETRTKIKNCVQKSFCSHDDHKNCIPVKYKAKQELRILLYFLITDELLMLKLVKYVWCFLYDRQSSLCIL